MRDEDRGPRTTRVLTRLGLATLIGLGAVTASQATDMLPPPMQPGTLIPDGQIEAAIAAVDGVAEEVMKRSGIPGMALVVVRDGKIVHAKGFGVRKVGEPATVDTDTVFQLASLSKSISATIVAHKIADGTVAWTTPLVRHLPWFELSDPYVTDHVTVGDMFAHRSGLPGHAGDDLEDIGFDRREVLERLRFLPLASFRDTYAYTNFGLTAAAEAVAGAAGTDWETLADETLFEPLGMETASFRFADFESRENRAAGHVETENGYAAKFVRHPDAQAPAGGVSASVTDLGKWLAMVMDTASAPGEDTYFRALLPAIQAQVVSGTIPFPAARPGLYGFGFGTGVDASGRVSISHSGAFALGAGTNFVMLPLENVAIGVLTNAAPIGAAESVGHTFMDLVEFGEAQRDWYPAYAARFSELSKPVGTLVDQSPPTDPRGSGLDDSLLGTYANDYFGPLEIADSGEGLEMRVGPGPTVYALSHWDGRVYVLEPRDENNPERSLSKLTFAPSAPRARATSVTVEFLDGAGMGTFTRE